MEVYEAVSARHSVREFVPDAVPRDALERIVNAAANSPSSENEQAWEFYVTTGKTRHELGQVVAQTTVYLTEYMEVLGPERYQDAVKWFSSLGDAPVLIAVAVPDSDDEFKRMNRLISVGAAIENLLLAVGEEGLAACPFTFSYWVKDQISDVLAVPKGQSVVSIIAVGRPAKGPVAVPEKRSEVAVWLD